LLPGLRERRSRDVNDQQEHREDDTDERNRSLHEQHASRLVALADRSTKGHGHKEADHGQGH